jgi:hypothetical protein
VKSCTAREVRLTGSFSAMLETNERAQGFKEKEEAA